LNLSREVLESQQSRVDKRAAKRRPLLEAQVVDLADSIAYDAHDVDDAVKLGLLRLEDLLELPLVRECHRYVTERFGPLEGKMLRRTLVHQLIDDQVGDALRTSQRLLEEAHFESAQQAREAPTTICTSPQLSEKKYELERLLFATVYRNPVLLSSRQEAQGKLRQLFQFFCQRPDRMPIKFQQRIEPFGLHRAVADYLAGMTDHFCLQQFQTMAS
jgi:dGTPase